MSITTTYAAIVAKIRELSFDRFITPTFFIKQRSGLNTWKVEITTTAFIIKDATPANHTFLFADYPTLDELVRQVQADMNQDIEIIYSGGFIGSEPTNSLNVQSDLTLETYKPLFRKYYFSDAYMLQFFREYAYMRLDATHEYLDTVDWSAELSDPTFTPDKQDHFALWVSYQLVGRRRLFELANSTLQATTLGGVPGFYNGTTNFNGFSMNTPGAGLEVRVGSVFTLTEDSGTSMGLFNNGAIPQGMLPPWAVGSDNELMDYYSFWYRLQLWLRNRIEFLFGDQSLRLDTVVDGQLHLDRFSSRNYHAWFESFPWVWNNF